MAQHVKREQLSGILLSSKFPNRSHLAGSPREEDAPAVPKYLQTVFHGVTDIALDVFRPPHRLDRLNIARENMVNGEVLSEHRSANPEAFIHSEVGETHEHSARSRRLPPCEIPVPAGEDRRRGVVEAHRPHLRARPLASAASHTLILIDIRPKKPLRIRTHFKGPEAAGGVARSAARASLASRKPRYRTLIHANQAFLPNIDITFATIERFLTTEKTKRNAKQSIAKGVARGRFAASATASMASTAIPMP